MAVLCFLDRERASRELLASAVWAATQLGTGVVLASLFDPDDAMSLGQRNDTYGLMNNREDLLTEFHDRDVESDAEAQSRARHVLTGHARTIRDGGVSDVHVSLVFGDLATFIAEQSPDLIVRHQRVDDELRRSIRDASRTLGRPILATGENWREVRRALVAFDASPATGMVIRYLCESPLLLDAEIVLVHVGDSPDQALHLRDAARRLQAAGRRVSTRVERGHVSAAIHALLADDEFDLLVIGSSGRGSIRERFGATTTSKLLRSNPKATLIVR